jgi:hypothetical protein
VGAIIGRVFNDLDISSCFYNSTINPVLRGFGGSSNPGGVYPKNTYHMQLASTYYSKGWDFVGEDENGIEDIWFIRKDEYPRLWWENGEPVADAGADQTVYTCADVMAEVKLDGSGSCDPDGDELTFLWSWIVDSNEMTATGVDPNILLGVGEHTIELVVNDGSEDSEPNEVVITVIGPIEADVHIVPHVINRNNKLKRVMAIIRLPEGISKLDISDEPFILTPPGSEAIWQRVIGWRRRPTVFALFDKAEVMDELPNTGRVELTVTGKLTSGQCISGSDTVRIIRPRRRLRSRIRR